MKSLWQVLGLAASEWNRRDAPRMGASLAFYSLLSIAPLVVLLLGICALVFGSHRAQEQILAEFTRFTGSQSTEVLKTVLKSAERPAAGILANVVGLVTLLIGASAVLIDLHTALNQLWGVPAPTSSGVRGLIRDRLSSFAMVLGIGFLLLLSLLVSAALAVVGKFFGSLAWMPAFVWELINFGASVAVTSGMFALAFRFVPDVRLPWHAIWRGAGATAILFALGKTAIGLYLGRAGVASAYGAAGSLALLIIWVYYSAQIFYYGAILTHIYAVGSPDTGTRTAPAPATGTVSYRAN